MLMDLRPLTLGELLDRAFSLYRAHFLTFVAIMAPPAAVGAAISTVIEVLGAFATPDLQETASPAAGAAALLSAAVLAATFCALLVLYFVTYTAALGAATSAVSEAYFGRQASAFGAYRQMRGRYGHLLLLLVQIVLRVGGIMAAGTVLVVIAATFMVFSAQQGARTGEVAGVLLVILVFGATCVLCTLMMLRYGLSVAALVLEPITAGQAIRRSIELTRGRLWRVLVLGVFALVIAYVTVLLFQGPFILAAAFAGPGSGAALALTLLGALAGAGASAVSGPVMVVALALLYYDARMRVEGFDLQLMMRALDASGAPPSGTQSAATLTG